MTESPITCMRCDGNLEVGFLLDRVRGTTATGALFGGAVTGGQGEGRALLWADSSHVGYNTPIDEDGVHQIEVDAYRCTKCGRVELFAGLGTGKS